MRNSIKKLEHFKISQNYIKNSKLHKNWIFGQIFKPKHNTFKIYGHGFNFDKEKYFRVEVSYREWDFYILLGPQMHHLLVIQDHISVNKCQKTN